MTGFPSRILRSSLGPKLRDTRPVENPETDIPADSFEALFRQVCGMNLGVGRVHLVVSWTGSSLQVVHQSEAWSPDNDQAHPVLTRVSAGIYTYEFASSYKDGAGRDVPTFLGPPRVSTHNAITSTADIVRGFAWVDPGAPLVVQVRLLDANDDPVDAPFWLEVL